MLRVLTVLTCLLTYSGCATSGSRRPASEVTNEQFRAEKMRVRVMKKLAPYHLSDEFLREREAVSALDLRTKLQSIVPDTRDEVRALIVEESGRVRAFLEQGTWTEALTEKLKKYLKTLEKLAAKTRNRTPDNPTQAESESDEEPENEREL